MAAAKGVEELVAHMVLPPQPCSQGAVVGKTPMYGRVGVLVELAGRTIGSLVRGIHATE